MRMTENKARYAAPSLLLGALSLFVLVNPALGLAADSDKTSAKSAEPPCVDIQVGNEHSKNLACLNAKLKAAAARQQKQNALSLEPAGPKTPAVESLGIANEQGTRERLGNAYGKSNTPQRPNNPKWKLKNL
jgi:hypothetical protein